MKYFSRNIYLAIILALFLIPTLSFATPEYSARTGQSCKACHIKAEGGTLSVKGLEYAASGYVWPPKGGYRILVPIKKPIRLVIGFLHIVAAFLWFGTILYVHIMLRPAYAAKGLPRGEVSLGMFSMVVVGITGVLLTISRIKSVDVLSESEWGLLLSAKILIYLIMLLSAFFIVVFIGPKLKRQIKRITLPRDSVFDPHTLLHFDGKDERPAFVACQNKVYDVSGLKLWKNGIHMKHHAGTDLTGALQKAPHGVDKLEPVRVVGSFDPMRAPEKTPPQKAFYFVAYMNLALVFLALSIIALWRWGV